jgi:hypothetical protein
VNAMFVRVVNSVLSVTLALDPEGDIIGIFQDEAIHAAISISNSQVTKRDAFENVKDCYI